MINTCLVLDRQNQFKIGIVEQLRNTTFLPKLIIFLNAEMFINPTKQFLLIKESKHKKLRAKPSSFQKSITV